MAKRVVFLQLAPEFGSTKFGPFNAPEIRLGSDPSRNDIVLPEALGVAPEHARLVKQPDESFILAPVERTANVYVWRADGRPAKQVTSPIAVVGNDGFSLVTQEGPRFIIVLEHEKKVKGADEKDPLAKAKNRLNAGTLAEEIKRQGLTRALTTTMGQSLSNGVTFIRSGSFLQPRYIFMGLMIVSGWIFAGSIGCAMIGTGVKLSSTNSNLEQCQADLGAAVGSQAGGEDPTLNTASAKILGDETEWNRVFEEDKKLRAAYAQRLKVIKQNPERYQWAWRRQQSPFTKFRARLETESRLKTPKLVRVLAYLAALDGENKESEWKYLLDSNNVNACGRGPALMTYRQAKQLDFENVQPDAVLDARLAAQGDEAAMMTAITQTALAINVNIDTEGVTINQEQGTTPGGGQCIFLDGDDDRSDETKLIPAIGKKIGIQADGLPGEGQPYWIVMRLMKYYAADFDGSVFPNIKYNQGNLTPSVLLDSTPDPLREPQKKYALDATADLIARAAILPCLAMQDKENVKGPPDAMKKDQPSKMQCAMFLYLIDEE
jgi:hypothetical protein